MGERKRMRIRKEGRGGMKATRRKAGKRGRNLKKGWSGRC